MLKINRGGEGSIQMHALRIDLQENVVEEVVGIKDCNWFSDIGSAFLRLK